jgi:outer membrane protein
MFRKFAQISAQSSAPSWAQEFGQISSPQWRVLSLAMAVTYSSVVCSSLMCSLWAWASSTPPAASSAERLDDEQRAIWTLGVGGGGGVVPHYPAADQVSMRALIIPTFSYRGRILRADDEGTRARFFRMLLPTGTWEVDLSGSGAFPVDANENITRQGMPPLEWIAELGPRISYRMRLENGRDRLRLSLPVRGVVSADPERGVGRIAARGWATEPSIQWERRRSPVWKWILEYSFDVYDAGVAGYYYTVAPQFATIDRPSYEAKGGYAGSNLSLAFIHTLPKANLFFAVSQIWYRNSANEASPLFRSLTNTTWAVGLSVNLFESKAREDQSAGAVRRGL